MQSPLTFDRPLLLLLLPLALAYFWAMTRRSYAGLHPATLKTALGTRGLVAALLVFALAGLHVVKRSDNLTTLFLLDVSKSIRPEQRAAGIAYYNKARDSKRSGDQAGVIVFGRTAFLEAPPSESQQSLGPIRAAVAGDATDLSQALRLASATFPPGAGKKIVILSDGNENIGQSEAELDSLRAQGVRVDVAPTALGAGSSGAITGEAMIDQVALPTHARQDAPFTLRVVASSTVAQTATLTLERDGQPIGAQKVQLAAGKNAFTYTQAVHQSGFHKYDATLTAPQDQIAENNHGYGFVAVQGRPRVLYVTDTSLPSPTQLKQALAAQQIDVDVQPPGSVPASVAALASYDEVVLSDVPAEELGAAQMGAIESASKDFGVGLGMIGGVNSFASGHYNGTPIEAALPVRMDVKDKKRFPTVAVAMVIEDLEEPASVNMSIEAAKATVDLLEPQDQVGVLDCNGQWRIPMGYVTDRQKIKDQMSGLTDMNDPPAYDEYLLEAARVLNGTNAQIKHIIFLGDGDAENPGASNIQTIKNMGISVSTVATGADASGVQYLATMAQLGGGQSYVAEKAEDLPRLLLKDQQSISKLRIIEEPFLPRFNGGDEVISGVDWAGEPPLLGYNVNTAKPGATVALTAPDHSDPIFAYWRYGLARTWAFSSDDRPHWATHWMGWPGYARFWAQALRWSLRSNTHADFQATTDTDNGKGHLVVDAFTAGGGFVNNAPLNATVVAPDLTTKAVTLSQTAPGRYEGTFDTDQSGSYMLNVRRGGVLAAGAAPPSETVGLVVPYSPEFRTLSANLPLLTRLTEATGGKIQPDATRVFRDSPTWVVGVLDLAPALLLTTALLFLFDVAVRRLALRPQQVRETAAHGVQAVGARVAAYNQAHAASSAVLSTPQMERLLERKTATRAASSEDLPVSTTERLLNRRAARGADVSDNPFPQVTGRLNKPQTPPDSKPAPPDSAEGYTNRLLDAKRRAQQKDE